ncbi:MAG: ATP synthase F0 subunit B, F-type H+-transporting ATPase subunit b [Candidatus Peregrinibacteria bacterium GW2011_GWC2_39_14]|nr:MAG: ATP synthase subunit b [Candidatus Peregrinibacteria bacterium GW2011_GWA2_38_36]KKR04980.1 MAG: ATP synthase F0 subunit B, F-type H+-transporting ATPase subunit b [Candidatus Peregrinibacteria bacterium GW2011_GWC2_39_14]
MELIEKLGIDWKLIIAQIINFGIVLFLLYKFAYKPVLSALDKRKNMIEKGVNDAKKSEELLAEIENMKERALNSVKEKTAEMMAEAAKEASSMKQEMLAEAHNEAKKAIDKAKTEMEAQKQSMLKEAKSDIGRMIVAATTKILEREFSESDQKRLMEDAAKEIANVI